MRGSDERSGSLFSYVGLEARVRAAHPLRLIRDLANAALGDLSGEFGKLYTDFGRPFDCTGEVASGGAPAGVLWGSLGTACGCLRVGFGGITALMRRAASSSRKLLAS